MYCIEPIFGSLMALFLPAIFSVWAGIDYPNETATWTLLIGGGLITLAMRCCSSTAGERDRTDARGENVCALD